MQPDATGSGAQLPAGSMIVRAVIDADAGAVARLTVMLKGPAGYNPALGDWWFAETDPWGNDRVGLEITGQLKRSDWGMKFNQALGSGNLVVSDTVKIALDVSAIKQAQ